MGLGDVVTKLHFWNEGFWCLIYFHVFFADYKALLKWNLHFIFTYPDPGFVQCLSFSTFVWPTLCPISLKIKSTLANFSLKVYINKKLWKVPSDLWLEDIWRFQIREIRNNTRCFTPWIPKCIMKKILCTIYGNWSFSLCTFLYLNNVIDVRLESSTI